MDKINASSIMFDKYLVNLKHRIFKILPLYEEGNENVFQYTQSLLKELCGLTNVVEDLDENEWFLTIIGTLDSLSDEYFAAEYDLKYIKSEVLRCCNIIDRLQEKEV